jgi:hypothetical protein
MKAIGARDASILSLLARHTSLPKKERQQLIPELGRDAQRLARAILHIKATPAEPRRNSKATNKSTARSSSTQRTARALNEWANTNHRIAAASLQRKKDDSGMNVEEQLR